LRAGGITSQRQAYASWMLHAVRLLEVNAKISFKVTAEVYFDKGAGDLCKRGALDRQCRGRQEPPQSFKVVITKPRVRRTAAAVRFPSFHEAHSRSATPRSA
jgi:hypothetical protein